jgi:hypothetical protein
VRSTVAARVCISLRGVPFSMMSLVLMQSCMLGGVSCGASANIACMVADTWKKRSVVFVVTVVFLCRPLQNALVLIWIVPSGISTTCTKPLILASVEMTRSGVGL